MHNISFIAAIHNMLQQHTCITLSKKHTCITSPGIHNIYKQKGAKHVQAHTYHIVSYITPTKWF
jgi:ribosomal protein L11 methylase PrmA